MDFAVYFDHLRQAGYSEEDVRTVNRTASACNYSTHLHLPSNSSGEFCPSFFDALFFICWPTTSVDHSAVIECSSLEPFDPRRYGTRPCLPGGQWGLFEGVNCTTMDVTVNNYTDIDGGVESEKILCADQHGDIQRTILTVGTLCSTLVLIAALGIFASFKPLWCLRNVIHCNLIISFLVFNGGFLLLKYVTDLVHGSIHTTVEGLFVVIFMYGHLTIISWMFVEGLYLSLLVGVTFAADRIRFWHFFIVGWVLPAGAVGGWLTYVYTSDQMIHIYSSLINLKENLIFEIPAIILVALSTCCLIFIVVVLIGKMRATSSLQSKQYWRAARAICVLVPLVGGQNVITFWAPKNKTLDDVINYATAIAQATQGIIIAVLYCFLNGEVQTTVSRRIKARKHSFLLRSRSKTGIASGCSRRVDITEDEESARPLQA